MLTLAFEVVSSALGSESFSAYERKVYEKHQKAAEEEIARTLKALLSNFALLSLLLDWAKTNNFRLKEFRSVGIRFRSGRKYELPSPVFIERPPAERPRGRPPKRRKKVLRHLGLELLGLGDKVSPAFREACATSAALCPSFEVASSALAALGVEAGPNLIRNVVYRFADEAMPLRVECQAGDEWRGPGLRILVCVDGGRARERLNRKARRRKGRKTRPFRAEWFEPRQLVISQFDEEGVKSRDVVPILDGSCGDINAFFSLLKSHLTAINLKEAAEIVFCADGGKGLWPRIKALANELGLDGKARSILDYTHAKQNMREVRDLIVDNRKLSAEEVAKLDRSLKMKLWQGNIKGIEEIVKDTLKMKPRPRKSALKKLREYFAEHSKFQYADHKNLGLPTGSGSVESAIRRVINLRIKGPGIFWNRNNAGKMIFLRSLVLAGKLRNAFDRLEKVGYNTFENKSLEEMTMAA